MLKTVVFYSVLSENVKTWSLQNLSILEAKALIFRTEMGFQKLVRKMVAWRVVQETLKALANLQLARSRKHYF